MAALELQPTSGVVITGGASGIGLATAHAVAEVGRPVAIWDLHPERATEAAEAVAAQHGVKTIGMAVDAPDAAVVGIASIHGIVANPMNPAYAASKAGVLGLTRSLAIRFAQEGIRVNAICPGFIETPMLPDIGDLHDRFAAASPMHRLGKPSEIGKTARFLLSTDASFITGTQVVVDGGCTITDM